MSQGRQVGKRLDLLVDERLVVELEAVENLKATRLTLGRFGADKRVIQTKSEILALLAFSSLPGP